MQEHYTPKGKHLTIDNRRLIERWKNENKSNREIAGLLGKAPQTIHNEVKSQKRYNFTTSEKRAIQKGLFCRLRTNCLPIQSKTVGEKVNFNKGNQREDLTLS
ncbi:transposase-like protein, IS1239 [Streptococcus pneumoniae]|nr:transposase-like protein, IS1239 [Streptococcus pneumoniae]VQL22089.1 transposase-like protein, IS1239 [Streptococcus pneumoniae]VRH72135.1 transposase-like protein, IS1239 [Streptococcus pneumoniae]VSE90735.1 transposase-like protein, IS1239 [Streptococcus pneumoniae]